MERDTTGCETASLMAAFAMLPDCATARRMCKSLSLIRRPIRSFQRTSFSRSIIANPLQEDRTFQLRQKEGPCGPGHSGRLRGAHGFDDETIPSDGNHRQLLHLSDIEGLVGADVSAAARQDHRGGPARRYVRSPGP